LARHVDGRLFARIAIKKRRRPKIRSTQICVDVQRIDVAENVGAALVERDFAQIGAKRCPGSG
jgi:hypothetical protein